VKALLDPVIDFRAKSSSEAYADTLPPKVREAVEAHEVLVGMTHRMVIAAMGEPKTKEREHASSEDPDSPIYEEWIYGDPPQPTQFVRFKNGRVARLEIAAIGKPIEVHDKNEMGADSEPTLQARTIVNGDVQVTEDGDGRASAAPTLRRPGEVLDTPQAAPGMGKVKLPTDPPDQQPSTQPQHQPPAASPQQPPSTPDNNSAPKLMSDSPRM